MGVTPFSLSVAETIFEKQTLYEDIAQYLHRRKIKVIEFRKGISVPELNIFIAKISLPPIELIKGGGLSFILKNENVANVSVEELDYYSLLKAGGIVDEECKDVWVYLLNKAVNEENQEEIEEFSERLSSILPKFEGENFLQNDDLMKALNNFLEYLNRKKNPKITECSKAALKMVLRSKAMVSEKNVGCIKEIVKHLSENDVYGVLMNSLLTDEKFDMQSMQLFSMLVGERQHQNIAVSLKEKLKNDPRLDAKNIRRIKELFLGIANPLVSVIYRQALSAIIEEGLGGQEMAMDRSKLFRNYRFMLLNLLEWENDENEFNQLAEKIINELARVMADKDAEFVECLFKALEAKKHLPIGQCPLIQDLHDKVVIFLEEKVLLDTSELKSFDSFLHKASHDRDFYFERIFSENGLNSNTLRLFLKFFPKEVDELCVRFGTKRDSPIFLKKIIDSLKNLDTPDVNTILIYIYKIANQFLRAEIIKTMQNLSYLDEDFLMQILEKEDIFLRKQALVLLAKDTSSCAKALRSLLLINNFFGFNNKIIEQNINIIAECEIKAASDYLEKFSKIKVFWKKDLKKAAINVLTEWHDRKN